MLKNIADGFMIRFIISTLYLIAVNFFLIYFAESIGYYDNIPLVFAVALVLNAGPFAVVSIIDRANRKKPITETEEFLTTGTRANARILDIQDTGVTINENPVVRLTMEINPDMAGTFTQTADLMISRINIPRVGDTIRVIYDPKDLSKFSLEQ